MEDKLEKSLKELLVTSNTVVLPGFGAFVATDIPAMVDSQNNVIYPPRRKVNYNPSMTTDDGMLTGHYARQERISKDTATEHISQFVEEVNHRLHRGNAWIIEDLGKFIIDGLNHLNFFPDPDQNFVPQSFGLPEVELLTNARPEYPVIEEVAPPVKPVKKEEKKVEKKKEKPEKPVKEGKKRSKVGLFIILFILILGGGAFAILTMTEGGKKVAVDLKHKIDGLMGKKEEHPATAEVKKEGEAVAEHKAEEAAPAEGAHASAAEHTTEAKEGSSYKPRSGSKTFDTPDRLDIEPTKMDGFVKTKDGRKKEIPVETKTASKSIIKPTPEPVKTVAKVEPKKVEPAKTETKKVEPKKTEPAKKAEPKKVEPEKKDLAKVEPKSSKPTTPAKTEKKEPAGTKPAPTKPAETRTAETAPKNSNPAKYQVDEDPLPKNVKAVKSNESIYSKYQIVVSEYKSIEDAVSGSDRYSKAGYNTAVIQFKDGKFGVCLARTSDRDKADKMLSDIRRHFGDARIKEY